jgi:hypothetical protein
MMGFGAWLGYDAALTEMIAVSIVGFSYAVVATICMGGLKELPYVFIGGMFRIFRSLQGHLAPKVEFGDDSSESGAQASESEHPEKTRRPRPKGWIPFAPAILVGTVVAWVVTARAGGFL